MDYHLGWLAAPEALEAEAMGLSHKCFLWRATTFEIIVALHVCSWTRA